MSEKALESCSGDASAGKASIAMEVDERSSLAIASRLSGFRASTATARLP